MENNNSDEELEIKKEIAYGTKYAIVALLLLAISITIWFGIFIYTSF